MGASTSYIISFIRENRQKMGLTQEDIAARAGVGLRFVRDLEQGKETVQLNKVNQILALFGAQLIPGNELDCFKILKEHYRKRVRVELKNKAVYTGTLTDYRYQDNKIYAWHLELENDRGSTSGEGRSLTWLQHQDIATIENV